MERGVPGTMGVSALASLELARSGDPDRPHAATRPAPAVRRTQGVADGRSARGWFLQFCRSHLGGQEPAGGGPVPEAENARVQEEFALNALTRQSTRHPRDRPCRAEGRPFGTGRRKSRRIRSPGAGRIIRGSVLFPCGATSHADSRLDPRRCWIVPCFSSRLGHRSFWRWRCNLWRASRAGSRIIDGVESFSPGIREPIRWPF